MFAENVVHNLCCQWKSQSNSPRMCEWDYTIDKSLVCLQSERRTSS